MQQSNTKPLQQTYHTTQTHLKSYVFLLCSFCWILPRGICIRCYNLLVAKYVTRPFVFSENPTQSLHQQRRSVHQCSEDVSMDCTMQQPSVSSAHSLRIERPRTFVSLLEAHQQIWRAGRRSRGLPFATTFLFQSSSLLASSTLTCLSRHHCQSESPRGPRYFVVCTRFFPFTNDGFFTSLTTTVKTRHLKFQRSMTKTTVSTQNSDKLIHHKTTI